MIVRLALSLPLLLSAALPCIAQPVDGRAVTRTLTVTEMAAGTDASARDEAVDRALRKAVEQACGVFLTSQAKARNYKGIYDKVFADAVGYVREHDVLKTWTKDDITFAKVRAVVSTQKFQRDWATIAHTYHQEDNPRVLIAIAETSYEMVNEVEREQQDATVTTDAVALRARQDIAADRTAASVTEGGSVREQGTFNRRGVPRPRNWQTTEGGQATVAGEQVRGSQEARIEGQAVSTTQHASRDRTWRRVARETTEGGFIQGKVQEFFIERGIKMMDRGQAGKVSKRDLMLATADEDLAAINAIGVRYQADVILSGTAAAEFVREVRVAGQSMYQFQAKLVARAVRTDSGQLLMTRTFGPVTVTTMNKAGGTDKALAKLAEDVSPQLLSALVEAWRRQVNVTRDVNLMISGLTYREWKDLKVAVEKLRGVKAARLREITQSVATIDIDSELTTQQLADRLTEIDSPMLEVTELTPNRLKLKVVK